LTALGSADGTVRRGRFEHLAYLEAGAGEPLFLLHGGTMTAAWNWDGAIPLLAQRFRVIAPDTPGHGSSDNPRDELRYEDVADDVLALAASLGVREAAFYGFSDGAQVALEIALRRPDFPSGLVLNAVLHRLDDEYLRAMEQLVGGFADAVWRDGQPDVAAECLVRHADWPALAPQVWRLWTRPLDLPAERLATIAAPTLLLTGDRDPFIPLERTVELLRLLPTAELAVVPGAAHAYDERFTRLALDFLLRR